jgi:hypothetical protein
MAVTESLVSGQNEAQNQQFIWSVQQQFLSSMGAVMTATATACVSKILNPGASARSFQERVEMDVPGEQIRTKGAQTTPPVTP